MAVSTLLATFLCTMVLPVLLILVALRLWEVYMVRGRDPGCPSPLPPGSMGLPFLGETLQLILQVNTQHRDVASRFFRFLTLLKQFWFAADLNSPLRTNFQNNLN